MDAMNMPALYAALAKAQGEFPEIPKNREVQIPTRSGPGYKFKYADLQQIIAKTKPCLSKYGLAVMQLVQDGDDGATKITTMLTHAEGGMVSSTKTLPPASDNDPKTMGGLLTYYRRYTYSAMIGVSADDDLDERDTTQQESNVDADVIVEMTANANLGTKVYRAYWVGLTDKQRQERKALHAGMKRLAAEADKKAAEEIKPLGEILKDGE